MYLVKCCYNQGQLFPGRDFDRLKEELATRFAGAGEGLWKDGGETDRDDIVGSGTVFSPSGIGQAWRQVDTLQRMISMTLEQLRFGFAGRASALLRTNACVRKPVRRGEKRSPHRGVHPRQSLQTMLPQRQARSLQQSQS